MHFEFRDNHLGFSLIEMLAIISIVSILFLSSAHTIFNGFNRIQAWVNLNSFCSSFIQTAQFARNAAISNQTYITLMPAVDNSWQTGWVVYLNPDLEFSEEILPTTLLLKQITIKNTQIKTGHLLTGNEFEDIGLRRNSNSGKLKHITFNPAGGAQMKNGGLVANRLVFQHSEFEDIEQHIIMGAGGRIRLCIPTDENLQCRR